MLKTKEVSWGRTYEDRSRAIRWSSGLLAMFALGCGSLNCSPNQHQGPKSSSTHRPSPDSSNRATADHSVIKADGSNAYRSHRQNRPKVLLKKAELTPLVERPNLLPEALSARIVAQQKLLARDPLLENQRGSRVEIEAPEYLENDDRYVDKPIDARPPATVLASAGHAAMGNLDELPGSAGLLAEPSVIERIDGNSLGLYLPFEDPNGTALNHFYRALRDLKVAPRDADGRARKVQVAAYGASHTQADIYTDYLRTYLQERFGNAGHGYVSMVRTNRWYRHTNYSVSNSRGWIVDRIQKRGALEDGHYGLLGSSARSKRAKHYAKVKPRNPEDPRTFGSHYVVSFLKQPRGGHFYLYANGEEIARVRTSGRKKEPAFHRFELPLGAHTIEVRPQGNGEVRIFGVTIERDEPGVVVDTLGLSGTRASNQLKWNEDTWRISLQQRQPDLYILAFGTNESTDAHQPIADYEQELRAVIQRYKRAAPEASCLIVGPGDFAKKIDDNTWRQVPRLLEVIKVQRKVSADSNCAFWDALEFMGGDGTMALWTNSYPQMASRDHIHLTRRGYVRMGMNIVDALMTPFDRRFLADIGQGGQPGTPAWTQSP